MTSCAARQNLRVGLGPPHRVRLYWPACADFAPLTASGGSFDVRKPSGAEVSWSGALETVTADGLYLTYALASTADIDEAGDWVVIGKVTTPVGARETMPRILKVYPKFEGVTQ